MTFPWKTLIQSYQLCSVQFVLTVIEILVLTLELMDVPTGIHSAWPGLFIEMVLYLQNCDWSWRWNSVIFCPPDMIISKRLHVSHTMVGITSTSYQSRIYKQSFPAWFMMFKLGFTTMFCGFQILKYTCKINRVVYFVDL